ncbi:hypothetical protein [Streptomyces sp. CS159]|uniref:hypothetical protein n=1 Tax=Streptomyces sp. CS159 TaxID=1982762 RepID=UPI0015C65C86|nr:hypothetical protein [Streptomyces sp. CS159]
METGAERTTGGYVGRAGVDADVAAGHLVQVRVGDLSRFDLGDEVHEGCFLSSLMLKGER